MGDFEIEKATQAIHSFAFFDKSAEGCNARPRTYHDNRGCRIRGEFEVVISIDVNGYRSLFVNAVCQKCRADSLAVSSM